MKLLVVKVFVFFIRILYAPMKLRKTQNKILWLSRQSDIKSDDMKMLSDAIAEKSPQTKQVFRLRRLKDESGLSLSYVFSVLVDMWELSNAGIAITDTYSIPLSCLDHKDDLKVFQIWHALGAVKKFGLQSAGKKQGRNPQIAKAMRMHKNYDYVIAPSEKTAEYYCDAFGCSMDKIIIASLPRVDRILDESVRYEEFIKCNPQYKNKKIFVYFPTFRRDDSVYTEKLFNAFAGSQESALIVSPHPSSKTKEAYKINGDFSVYDLAKLSDGIITDYSAISLECSLLGKPIWFYIPDYDVYKNEQGLNTDIMVEMKNACFREADSVVEATENGIYNFDELKRFSDKYIKYKGTDNTAKLADIICSEL